MAQAQTATQPGAHAGRPWLGLSGIAMGVFMFTLDASIVNVALPTLTKAFGTTFSTVQWVVLSYLLIATALVLAAAWIGDRAGKKRAYLTGLALFTLGSLFCGLAPTVGWLIACRALQGLGAVFVSALGAAIVGEIFGPEARGRAMGVIGSAVFLGIALGPSVGGLIIQFAGWRWMFLVNIPVGISAFFVIQRFVPPMPGRASMGGFDWAGTVLACSMLSALALGLTWGQRDGFDSPHILALLATAVIGFGAFLAVESQVAVPTLDLRVFRNRPFSAGLTMSGLVFLVLGGAGFLLPFYLEIVAGYPTAKVGLLMAVSPVLGGLTAPLGGTLADRLGARGVSLAGLALLTAGCALFASAGPQISALEFALRIAPIGMGMGFFNAANNSSVLNAVARERLGIASALLSLMRTLGQTTGVPLLAAVFSIAALGHAVGGRHPTLLTLPARSLVHGMHWAFAIAACIALVALTAGAWDFARRRAQSIQRSADRGA